jgi:hypothetical protein
MRGLKASRGLSISSETRGLARLAHHSVGIASFVLMFALDQQVAYSNANILSSAKTFIQTLMEMLAAITCAGIGPGQRFRSDKASAIGAYHHVIRHV